MKHKPTEAQLTGMEVGINRAIDHANRVHDCDWADAAFDFLDSYLDRYPTGHLFTCEEVRKAAENENFLPPPDDRAWGGIMRKASGNNHKLVVKDGITYVGTHGRFGAQWRKL